MVPMNFVRKIVGRDILMGGMLWMGWRLDEWCCYTVMLSEGVVELILI